MPNITPFLQSVKLPSMPEAAYALIRTLKNEDADVPLVRNIIAQDPALTATLLRMANSAIFGLSRSVDTLDNAVSVVGMSHIRARALSICLSNAFPLPSSLNRMEFWRYCMLSAGYAKWLAASLQMDEQQAWLSAMMLRLGELIIAQHQPTVLAQIERQPCVPGLRWARERDNAGFDEGQIMAGVASHWDFPEAMVHAFASAADPLAATPFSPLAGIVHLACLLADQDTPTPDLLETWPEALVQRLQLNMAQLQASLPDPEALGDISLMHT